MLTADLVRVRRRGSTLSVVELNPAGKQRIAELAGQYVQVARQHIGHTRGELEETLSALPVHARDYKVAAGLRKLILDRCDFEVESGVDPAQLRRDVFVRASAARKALQPGERFDPADVLAELAREQERTPDELSRLLYVDLRSAHRLLSFKSVSADGLVELYELGQAQAVLLRAVRVTAQVRESTSDVYRALFHKMKFLGLLCAIEPLPDGGYELVIEGPFSMFRSVTKYGLKLALMLPALRMCERWSLTAQVKWGKDRALLEFAIDSENSPGTSATEPPRLRDEVAALLAKAAERFDADKTSWLARPSSDILVLPGAGVCVPDLVFEHQETGVCIYLEVMGFWSRDAVWKRVELVEQGLPDQILFAVSSRLRVSEAALDRDLPGALYVYKGAMSIRSIEQKLDAMANHKSPTNRP